MATLDEVLFALGIQTHYMDATIQVYFDEVVDFLKAAGVPASAITSGIVARGVADLWNYGGAEGKLSEYFIQRASQLSIIGVK